MKTVYLRLVQVAEGCAFAPLLADWVYTPLIRVHRNRIGREQWEWVSTGRAISPRELEKRRRNYPLAKYT